MTENLIRTAADWAPVFRARIRELGLTHLEVDHRAGIADGLTSKILCGMKQPRGDTLMRMCGALGIALAVVTEEKCLPPHDRALRSSPTAPMLLTTEEMGDGSEAADKFPGRPGDCRRTQSTRRERAPAAGAVGREPG
jgi:hypothetical protein